MRIALLCGDSLLLDGLKCVLANHPEFDVVSAERSWQRVESQAKRSLLDVVVIASISAPGEAAKASRARKRLGFSLVADEPSIDADVHFSRSAGIEGLKSALNVIRTRTIKANVVREPIAAYGSRGNLTPREREVARLVSQGMPNRRIATALGIQEQSVKNLVSVVMRKLRCENRVQLALHLSSARH